MKSAFVLMRIFPILLFPILLSLQPCYAQKKAAYLKQIKNEEEFKSYCGKPLSAKYNRVEAIKIVHDIESDKIYYINSDQFDLHYTFCSNHLNYPFDLGTFNERNYEQHPKRAYHLVNLNYFKDHDVYVIEFNAVDHNTPEQMADVFHRIRRSFFEPEKLRVFLNTGDRLLRKNTFDLRQIPTITPETLYAGQKFQIIQKAKSSGILVRIGDSDDDSGLYENFPKDAILLLNRDLNVIPACRGIITTRKQTPLSHICILAQNRKIPVISWDKAFADSEIQKLVGEFVTLEVLEDTFLLTKSSPIEVTLPGPPAKTIKLKLDTSYRKLPGQYQIRERFAQKIGSKATNLALLRHIPQYYRVQIPEGIFAIPFYYYFQHIRSNHIDDAIDQLLANYQSYSTRGQLDSNLRKIRKLIKNAPVDHGLLQEVQKRISSQNCGNRYRFRSSSNAEDLPGFNGAGLYDSKTGIVGDEKKTVEKAMKQVWASLWNLSAFEERELFKIDHRTAAMGILVHRSFPDEYANGVAITKNLYRDYHVGFIINTQIGETKVVDPPEGVVCEQLISLSNQIQTYNADKNQVDYITFSNLNDNKPILSNVLIFQLTTQLSGIKQYFYYLSGTQLPYKDFGLDVEFKVMNLQNGKKTIYIKQVRPYNN